MNDEVTEALRDGQIVNFPYSGESEYEIEMLVMLAEMIVGAELIWGVYKNHPETMYVQRRDAYDAEESPAC